MAEVIDAAFAGVGQTEGLTLWRIEAKMVVKQPAVRGYPYLYADFAVDSLLDSMLIYVFNLVGILFLFIYRRLRNICLACINRATES